MILCLLFPYLCSLWSSFQHTLLNFSLGLADPVYVSLLASRLFVHARDAAQIFDFLDQLDVRRVGNAPLVIQTLSNEQWLQLLLQAIQKVQI